MAEENESTEEASATNENADGNGNNDGVNQEGASQDAGGGQGGEGESSEGEGSPWYGDIEDEKLANVASRYASPVDMIKAHHSLRNDFNKAIKVPGKGADEKEVAAFKKALGVPEDPTAYKFPDPPSGTELTDADKQFRDGWAKTFHKHALTKAQAEGLAAEFVSFSEMQTQKAIEEDKSYQDANEARLRSEWGEDFERNNNAAKTVLKEFGAEDLDDLMAIEMKDGRLLLDHPQVTKFLARTGLAMVNDRIVDPAMTQSETETTQEKIKEIMNLMYDKPEEYERRQPELRELNLKLYGGAAA